MKRLLLASLAAASVMLSAQAAPYEMTFSTVVTYSAPGAGLPAVGETISGRASFDYDPTKYQTNGCGPGCTNYFFSQPYTFDIDLAGKAIAIPYVNIGVLNDQPGYDPKGGLTDLVGFQDRVPVPPYFSYELIIGGPSDSFDGQALPAPAVMATFWGKGFFYVKSNYVDTQLSASLVSLQVSAVPEPAIAWLLAPGLLLLLRSRGRGA